MNSSDLFSFLDPSNDVHDDNSAPVPIPSTSSAKRKVPSRSASPQQQQQQNGDGNQPGPSKKARMTSPQPLVVDDMEIEAKREVPASAGLQGPIEVGSRLEIRHQVCI